MPTPRTAERSFEPVTSSVREARRFLTSCLESWGQDAAVWTGQLLLGELATNAVLHAGDSGFSVTVAELPDGALRLEVRDGSARPPRVKGYGTTATTGRGVALVEQLSRGWGVLSRGTGKVVWCEIVADGDISPVGAEEEPVLDLDAFLLADEDLPGPRRTSGARDEVS